MSCTARPYPVRHACGSLLDSARSHRYNLAVTSDELTSATLHHVLNAAPIAMLLVDAEGYVCHANPIAEELFLWKVADAAPLHIDTLVPQPMRAHHARLRTAYSEHPRQRNMGKGQELQAVRSDGTRFPVAVGLAPLTVDGQAHVLTTVTDLSAREATAEARTAARIHALEVQRLESLALMAGGIAHDFNNLLVAVLGNAQLAQSVDLPQLAAECVADIVTAAEQASDLSRQLLAYRGRGSFSAQPIDLSQVVLEARALLRSIARTQADVRTHCADGLPPVLADVGQIRQVLLNLVGNACDAVEGHMGTIHIATSRIVTDDDYMLALEPSDRPAGIYVVLEVSDNGGGIPPHVLPKVFEPMVSTRGGGRGMGLAAVRGIVVGHDAALTVYSEVGRGTTVKVLFPAIDGPSDDDIEPTPDERRGRHTILVADDNAMVRKFARRTLERIGYNVLLAKDGQEAMERFHEAKGKVDLALVDLTMPRLNGADTFRRLRLVDPEIRVVLTSGFIGEDVTAGLPARGLFGFLQKPFTPDQLREMVADALALGHDP